MQQGDVLLIQTNDDGNIIVEDGIVKMSGGLETSTYLSLFGGNEDDDGRDNNTKNWWGNLDENEPARRYRSETQNLLKSLPATSGNLHKIEDAAKRDLKYMLENKIASSLEINITIPALNMIKIVIAIVVQGEEITFEFVENWKASI